MTIDELKTQYFEEVESAIHSYLLWRSIHDVAASNPNVHRAMNHDAAFWNMMLHSLQTTFLITIGRLFDDDKTNFSAHTFLTGCIAEIVAFSKESLGSRKSQEGSPLNAAEVTAYLAQAYVPTIKDFQLLRGAMSQHAKAYRKVYKPIRNALYAHSSMNSTVLRDQLFGKTNLGEIWNALLFLHQCGEVVTQLYLNGRKTDLTDHNYRYEDKIRTQAEEILQRLCA